MSVPFYVIDEEPSDPDEPGWVDFERVYGFDWDAFSKDHWNRLEAALRQLPEVRSILAGAYAWYSDTDDSRAGYIHGSVEPPGLHVYGSIDGSRLSIWHDAFQRCVVGLPSRTDMD